MPIGIKITAPFAHLESIEDTLKLTAKAIQTNPQIPVVNTIINFGHFGINLIIKY